MKKIIIVLSLICSFISYAEDKPHIVIFNNEELKDFAQKIIRHNIENDYLNFFHKDFKNWFKEEINGFPKDTLKKRTIREGLNRIDQDENMVLELKTIEDSIHNNWRDKFLVFFSYQWGTTVSRARTELGMDSRYFDLYGRYFIAMSNQGAFYYLQGFKENDFEKLVMEEIAPVTTKDIAVKISNLYLATVAYNLIFEQAVITYQNSGDSAINRNSPKIIDTENYKIYKTEYEKLIPPKHSEKDGEYQIELCVLEPLGKKITLHKFLIGKNGEFKHESIIIQEAKEK